MNLVLLENLKSFFNNLFFSYGMQLVLTSHRCRERELLEELKGLGDFQITSFRDVIRGKVEDLSVFLEQLGKGEVFSLSKVVPIEKSFQFSPDKVVEEFCEAAKPLLQTIKKGEAFCIRVERRGLKGRFSSQRVAEEGGSFIVKALEERDQAEPRVNLEDPDKAIIFETLGRWCGIGIISREMRKRYLHLKLP